MRAAFALLFLPLIWSFAAAQVPVVAVTGAVRDSTGLPVRDAVVAIDGGIEELRTRTDAAGRFRIGGVPVGRHALQVARIGFRPHNASIDVPAGGLEVTVTLARIDVVLDTVSVRVARLGVHGTVTTQGISLLPHAPRSLRGAIIEVLDSPHRTTTDVDGKFSLPGVGEGSWSLLVRIDRYQSRMVAAYVPPEGGVEVTIVLDSTIADWQRREDDYMRQISARLREATNPSAFVPAGELMGPVGMTLKEALRNAPSTLSRGLVVEDNFTCVFVDGVPRPGMTAGDFLAEDVHAVEVYGIDGRGKSVAPSYPWPRGTFCGTGVRQGPYWRPSAEDLPRGTRGARRDLDNKARTIVVWMKRGRG